MLTRNPPAPDRGIIVFDSILIVLALILSRSWVLIGIDHDESIAVLQRCFKQTRSTATMRGSDYVVQCGESEMTVSIVPGFGPVRPPTQKVAFVGVNSRKAALIRSLFSKQFERSFPTPRIRA